MKKAFKRVVSFLLCVGMVVTMIPITSYAAVDYDEREDDYYKVISKDDYDIAPGITESEIVLNNAEGSQRQVAHVMEVDINNPYTKVMPSYKGMASSLEKGVWTETDDNGNTVYKSDYAVQVMSKQAAYAEANGYGNVVGAMNLSLSWYDSAYYEEHPELIGEPLGYMVLDGIVYTNSQGQTSGAQTCLVINFDERDGENRPSDIPKVEIRSTSSSITGWEEQVIPANFGFLVKDGVNQYKKDNNAANGASRSFVGIKEDGTIVMVMNDGRQAPYSTGFTNYEMAEFMLSLGCVQAVNGDGGGSSAFLSQRPGEELKLNCSPSDGAERPTTHGILVVSTAPSTGEFVRANITAKDDYYTPESTVEFTAIGTDLVGKEAEIPSDVTWQIKEERMGTIEDGVFVSNGTCGTVTAQMVYNGEVVGEGSVEIVIPEEFSFAQSIMTVPFDKQVTIGMKATINGGLNDVVLKESDVTFAIDNDALGTFDGFKFTSVKEENAPEKLTSTLNATLNLGEGLTATATLKLGKGSEVIYDFETGINDWLVGEVNGNYYEHTISHATAENGKVHDGNGSLKLVTNGLTAPSVSSGGYAQVDLYLEEAVVIENAKSIGFWAYIPDEYEHCWIRVLYWYDSDGNGTYDKKNTISVISQPEVYNTWDESGWKYFSVDVSGYESIMITGLDQTPTSASKNDANNYRFIEFMFPHTNTNDLWKTYGSINGEYTIYIDNVTADYSDAVDDREAPEFSVVNLIENDEETVLEKNGIVTTQSNKLNVSAKVAENTEKTNATGLNADSAKAYIDGVAVDFKYSNGRFTINDVAVADGVHRVKFEISDMMGNKAVVVRLINVESGVKASTVEVVPKDASLDRLYGGSVYWMNINATDIETIQKVTTTIDLNNTNHWELAHMEVAEGFVAEYVVDEETNTADIIITRIGENTQTGTATLASLPIRIISFDADMHIEGYTAETFWNTYDFWPQDLKVDVDMGEITYVDGYDSEVLNVFSNEEFSVDTEMYTSSANMDSAFKAERGTSHVHTLISLDDKVATCTEKGYTGRTYCEVCDSVVDWGTTSEVKGHSFTVEADGLYTCEMCGVKFYYIDGVSQTGWIEVDGSYYYFNKNGEAVDGETTIDGHTYTFTDYILTNGSWEHDGVGMTYWWAGEQLFNKWITIEGKKYHFTGIYMDTGFKKIGINTNLGMRYHMFDENGVLQEEYTGIYEYDGKLHYVKNGICATKGLIELNGDFYYINSGYLVIRNTSYTLNEEMAKGLVTPGAYYFGEDGKMVIPEIDSDEPEEPNVKNGVIKDEDGVIRYYADGVVTYGGLVYQDGYYYYICSSKFAITNRTYYISTTNGLLPMGYYDFDEEGRMINPPSVEPEEPDTPEEPEVKNGIIRDEDGVIRYYVDGVVTYGGLVYQDGYYYYICSSKFAITNRTYYISTTNGLLPMGYYDFDEEGRMINPPSVEPEEPDTKNGIIKDEDGVIRYYVDGVITYGGLVYQDGYYYYICSSKFAITNRTYYISTTNGLLPMGYYDFDEEGRMINPPSVEPEEPDTPEEPEVNNGIIKDEDGVIRYYVDGVVTYGGLVYQDGYYYYICSGKFAITNRTYYISTTNGLLPMGYYDFDQEGRMINPPA